MKISVIVDSELKSGGGHQYEKRIINNLKNLKNKKFDLDFFTFNSKIASDYEKYGINIKFIKESILSKIIRILRRDSLLLKKIFSFIGIKSNQIEKYFVNNKSDLIYFLSPCYLAIDIESTPFIVTVWDLCHLDHVEFPEIKNNSSFIYRETFYSKVLKRAALVCTDCEVTKNSIISNYQVNKDKINIIPFLPYANTESSNVDVKLKYSIKNDFIFYPAQFWPHKNHVYILEAIKILKEKHNRNIDIVFTGSDKGNKAYILNKISEYGLNDNVHILGFLPEEDIKNLYKEAKALVMPTYFGPTNIPPLEAFQYECPVFYSDFPSFRSVYGDAVEWMNLNDPNTLTNLLLKVLKDELDSSSKIKNGKDFLNEISSRKYIDDLLMRIESISIKRKTYY